MCTRYVHTSFACDECSSAKSVPMGSDSGTKYKIYIGKVRVCLYCKVPGLMAWSDHRSLNMLLPYFYVQNT